MKKTVTTFAKAKASGEKLTMLTAYDYSTAKLMDEAGVDSILVGDSLGNVVLGYEDTVSVTMEDMIHHGAAVARGAKEALVDTLAGAPHDDTFGTYTAAAAFFKTVGGYAFSFMLPVLAGYIARSIADRPGLAVGFVGGYIATIGCTFGQIAGDSTAVSGFLGALIAGFAGGYYGGCGNRTDKPPGLCR